MDRAVKESRVQVKVPKKGFLFNPPKQTWINYTENLNLRPIKDIKVTELCNKVTESCQQIILLTQKN